MAAAAQAETIVIQRGTVPNTSKTVVIKKHKEATDNKVIIP